MRKSRQREKADRRRSGDDVVTQPHHKWLGANRGALEPYSDSFVALDPEQGIVAHSPDGDTLTDQIDALSPEQRERVVIFHASMYLRSCVLLVASDEATFRPGT